MNILISEKPCPDWLFQFGYNKGVTKGGGGQSICTRLEQASRDWLDPISHVRAIGCRKCRHARLGDEWMRSGANCKRLVGRVRQRWMSEVRDQRDQRVRQVSDSKIANQCQNQSYDLFWQEQFRDPSIFSTWMTNLYEPGLCSRRLPFYLSNGDFHRYIFVLVISKFWSIMWVLLSVGYTEWLQAALCCLTKLCKDHMRTTQWFKVVEEDKKQ